MPEGRNTNRRPLIFVAIVLFIAAAAGLAAVYCASQVPGTQAAVLASVVESEAVIAFDDDAEGTAVQVDNTEEPKTYTRLDVGNLVLVKQKSTDAALEEVIGLFEDGGPLIIAKCYSVDACLKARQVMEPLAHDEVVQEAFYTVIIEAFDANQRATTDNKGISYLFAMAKCGIAIGPREYTSTGLFEAAASWYREISKSCPEQ